MEDKEIINEDQPIKEEQPVEEAAPVEEAPAEEPVQEEVDEFDTRIKINKPNPEEKPYGQLVEEERAKIIAQSKKGNLLSTLSIVAVMALSITGIFLLQVNAIVSYVLMGVALAVLIVFSIINHRVMRPDVNGYIRKASVAINEYVFADNRFSDVTFDPKDKLELSDVSMDGIYENLARIASRNLVEGKYEKHSFKVCECALFYPPQGRKQSPAFIGKYITFPNDLHFEGRIVLVFKGEKDEDIPNGLSDLQQLANEGNYFAYGLNNNSLKELDKKFISELKNISVSNHLLNLTVVVWSGKTIIYASYDDPTITLPFYEPFQEETVESYRRDLYQMFEALKVLVNKE